MLEAAQSARAERDMTEIWRFISLDDVDAADEFADQIYEKFHALAGYPEMGRRRDDLRPELRSFPFEACMFIIGSSEPSFRYFVLFMLRATSAE